MFEGRDISHDELSSIFREAAAGLRADGHDGSQIASLATNPVMTEVLGPWPPRVPQHKGTGLLPGALDTLEDAYGKLDPIGNPEVHSAVGELASRLRGVIAEDTEPGSSS